MDGVTDTLPQPVTKSVRWVAAHIAEVWAMLENGMAVNGRDGRNGLHRFWLVRDLEEGYQAERIGCEELARNFGTWTDRVRDGHVFEVYDHHANEVRGYLQWCGPRAIEEIDAALSFAARRTRTGRERTLTTRPTSVRAWPA